MGDGLEPAARRKERRGRATVQGWSLRTKPEKQERQTEAYREVTGRELGRERRATADFMQLPRNHQAAHAYPLKCSMCYIPYIKLLLFGPASPSIP